MANENVKFKYGSISNINSTTKLAGTVYFAIDSETNKGSIYFDKDASTRILMSEDTTIPSTYLKNVTFTSITDSADGKIKVIATLTKGNGETFTNLFPIAGPSLAGVITPEAQTIAGAKTFTGATTLSGGATFSNSAFNYSGIESGTTNAARVVWFADSASKGKPVYDNDFTYNPSTNTLTATNFAGTASIAVNDNLGKALTSYLYNVSLDPNNDTTINFTRGDGNTIDPPIVIKSGIVRRWTTT
jgi:hypothetical protein